MSKVPELSNLTIADARIAFAYAISALNKQAIHIFTPVIVQVQKGDTAKHKDLFSIYVHHEKAKSTGKKIVLHVISFSDYLSQNTNVKPKEAVIGEYGQWELVQ